MHSDHADRSDRQHVDTSEAVKPRSRRRFWWWWLSWGWRWGHALWWVFSPRLRFPVPTFVVGNVTIGGSGKTPIVAWLTRVFIERQYKPHVVMLGYGGRVAGGGLRDYRRQPVVRLASSAQPLHISQNHALSALDPMLPDPIVVGDEACDMVASMVNAPVWCGARRGSIAQAIGEGATALVVDDGLQHPLLQRAFHIVVLDLHTDWTQPIMPAGQLREPLSKALKRASAVVLTGRQQDAQTPLAPPLADVLSKLNPRVPVVRALIVTQAPQIATGPLNGTSLSREVPVVAVAGIGVPEKFFHGLRSLGYVITQTVTFPDHHFYTSHEILTLQKLALQHGAVMVTTSKDWIKMRRSWGRAGLDSASAMAAVARVGLLWPQDGDHTLITAIVGAINHWPRSQDQSPHQ